jgi:hypothetical protein
MKIGNIMITKFQESKPVFAVISNTDLTEGRGKSKIMGLFYSESHAFDEGKGKFVMGSNCPIIKFRTFIIDNQLYGPVSVPVSPDHYLEEDEKNQRKQEALDKAKALGLTDEEIEALTQ